MKLSAKTMKEKKKTQINIKHEKEIPTDAIEVLLKKNYKQLYRS